MIVVSLGMRLSDSGVSGIRLSDSGVSGNETE